MKYFIDTNIFLRVLTKDAEKQFEECVRFLSDVKFGKIQAVTSTIVFSEIAWTLLSYYKFEKARVLEALSSIHNLNGLSFEEEHDVAQTLILYKAHSVKYIDAMISSIAPLREKKWTIVSYDRDFDKLGLLRAEPVDLLEK